MISLQVVFAAFLIRNREAWRTPPTVLSLRVVGFVDAMTEAMEDRTRIMDDGILRWMEAI